MCSICSIVSIARWSRVQKLGAALFPPGAVDEGRSVHGNFR
jgi:hypothetical protein